MSIQSSDSECIVDFASTWTIDSSLQKIYLEIEHKKNEAARSLYWFQKAWRGFISSGSEENAANRICTKSFSVISVASAPFFSAGSLWGAFEISRIVINTMLNDPLDTQNNYATVGHIPEWIAGGLLSLYIARKALLQSINETYYQQADVLYQHYISKPFLNNAQKSRLAEVAQEDLKEIESNCLFHKHKLTVLQAFLTPHS